MQGVASPPVGSSLQQSHPLNTEALVRRYLWAKRHVIESGYAAEIYWQAQVQPSQISASSFVREAAWVILSAGMSERVVRRSFDRVRMALHDFDPATIAADPCVRKNTLGAFGHERKVDAILAFAAVAHRLGDEGVRMRLSEDLELFLRGMPYMGPATTQHLAKNLGWPVAKPDRHLVRLASRAGRPDPAALCEEISSWLGDPVHVVDVVLWRWSALHQGRCEPEDCDGLPHP